MLSRRLIMVTEKTGPDRSGPLIHLLCIQRSALWLKREIGRRRRAILDVSFLVLGAKLLLPDFDGVIARRHARDRVVALVVRHGEVGSVGRDPPAVHPAVRIAGDLDHFGLIDLLLNYFLELGLRHVER